MPHHTPHILLTALALLLACPPTPSLALERAATPMHQLLQAPYQLEVTTLSVETKQGPHSGTSIWCRVRIDRALAGPGLKPGDATAVVSVRYNNPPGTTGASGHWNIPAVGERRRLFASGTPSTLQPLPPNGWQPLTRAVHVATQPASAKPWADLLARIPAVTPATTPTNAELFLLTDPLSPQDVERRDLAAPLATGLPVILTGPALLSLAQPSADPAPTSTPPDPRARPAFTAAALRTAVGLAAPQATPPASGAAPAKPSTHTRILPPDPAVARHPLLVGIAIPPDGVLIPEPLPAAPTLLPTATVLLWGEAAGPAAPASPAPAARQPILWVTTQPRTAPTRAENSTTPVPLPPQRSVAITLNAQGELAHPTVRVLLIQSIGWALNLPDLMDRTSRDLRPPP